MQVVFLVFEPSQDQLEDLPTESKNSQYFKRVDYIIRHTLQSNNNIEMTLTKVNGNVCSPFKNYFNFLTHDFNTRNSGSTIALPKVKLDFAQKSFYFLGASTFNSLPLKIKQTSNRALFREFLDQFYCLV